MPGMDRGTLGAVGFALLTLFVVLLPFEDSILQNAGLGFFGSSLSLIPLSLMLMLFPQWVKNRYFVYIVAYSVFCSTVGLFHNIELVDNALARAMRFFLIWMTFFACIFWFRTWHWALVPLHAYGLLVVLCCSIVAEMVMSDFLLDISILHANPSGNKRPRGFALESSQFGYQIVLGFLFCGMMLRKNAYFTLIALVAAFFSGSKGALLCLLFSIVLARIFLHRGKLVKIGLALLLFPIILVVFNVFLIEQFQADLEDYTSLSSRLTLFVLAVQAFFANPLGYGFTGFVTLFPTNGPAALDFVQRLGMPSLGFKEVVEMFDPNETKNIGLKALFLEMAVIYGAAGVYVVWRNASNALQHFRDDGDTLGLTLVFFLVLSNLFFVSPLASFLTPMVIGVLLGRLHEKKLMQKAKA